MINKEIDKTLDLLVKDGDFLANFDEKLENFMSVSQEEQLHMIRKVWLFLFHIIDYHVTLQMIDMDADIYRLCQRDPVKASKLAGCLQKAALTMKVNYQYFCKEGTIYDNEEIGRFILLYYLALKTRSWPDNDKDKMPAPYPACLLTYDDIEFIFAGGDQDLIDKKLKACLKLNFTLDSIRDFISSCFHWADEMNFALKSMQSERTIVDIDLHKLERVYGYCNNLAFHNLTLEQFASAIRNIDKPKYCIQNADCFYALVLALYNAMGPLGSRDRWLPSVLKNFGLKSRNYCNARKRIQEKTTPKLCERYDKIMELLSE